MLVGSGSAKGQFIALKQRKNHIMMNGKAIFKFSVDVLPGIINTTLRKSNLTFDQVSVIFPHQANKRIIESAAERFRPSRL
jgi:3-oxoacyl-[acyl-carrier-protein] synthase-3